MDSSHQDLSSDILFDWFLGCLHFPIVFYNDIILTSGFQISIFCGIWNRLLARKVSML